MEEKGNKLLKLADEKPVGAKEITRRGEIVQAPLQIDTQKRHREKSKIVHKAIRQGCTQGTDSASEGVDE